MTAAPSQSAWTPLALLKHRFTANVNALATRYPAVADELRNLGPSTTYFVQSFSNGIRVGTGDSIDLVQPLPHPLPPAAAENLNRKLYPGGKCTGAVLITGEDLGWLWNSLYQLSCDVPAAPSHRPPLFFLMRSVERLWVILHLQEWQQLLADARVRLFVGDDAFLAFRRSLIDDAMCPPPKQSVTIDTGLWPAGMTIDSILADTHVGQTHRLAQLNQKLELIYAGATTDVLAGKYRSSQPLKILGFTSRYTTFLQYSMRDWLAAFERLGHSTRLVIESADHEAPNNLAIADACAQFQPDLVVMIDHFRAETSGVPPQVPVAMWVQDALPNLFTAKAGAAQSERDYALGFAKLKMVEEFGYPAQRYMPAVVALNEQRFEPRTLSAAERATFGCEVSFVSHASTPADAMLSGELKRLNSAQANRLLGRIFDELRSIYDGGGMVTEPIVIRRIAERAMLETSTTLPDEQMPALMDLFTQRINNALFRHQSLCWLAETGVNLHLYGRGWENHPTLHRFARGVADNVNQLATIYQASKISLQVTPHGAVHQRTFEALAAGGFVLMRYCPGDALEREFRSVWQWCVENRIASDDELRRRATAPIAQRLACIAGMLELDPLEGEQSFIEVLRSSDNCGYIRSAGAVWGDDYDAVCYRSADELRTKVAHFLANDGERAARAASMRRPVLERFTYTATTRRLFEFIGADLAASSRRKAAA